MILGIILILMSLLLLFTKIYPAGVICGSIGVLSVSGRLLKSDKETTV